jgi:hypothetical protein
VVGDEILRQLEPRAQLTHPPIAVRQLAQQPPTDGMPGQAKKTRRRAPGRQWVRRHLPENTSK